MLIKVHAARGGKFQVTVYGSRGQPRWRSILYDKLAPAVKAAKEFERCYAGAKMEAA